MRRRYKLIIIIFIGIVITYFIYFITRRDTINYLALGDGVASGETAYDIEGLSYNDYFKEKSKYKIKNYNNAFTKKNYKINELINDINDNKKNNQYFLKQLIHNADVVTIAIGMDEIVRYEITDTITPDYLKNYIEQYDNLISIVKDLTDHKIIIIGLYKNKYVSDSNIIILNSSLKNIADRYGVCFIDISEQLSNSEYFLKKESYYFNYLAHEKIAEMINYTINTCQTH